ncbi:MAG: RagB/SusD family nutrient uptake outer membrane protein [Bacteroidota bacterium]|nr:RagB/SusD family nutrient uptake outer membrane protein [Bacteroidota bacterium]
MKVSIKLNKTTLAIFLACVFLPIACMDDFLNQKPQGLQTEEVYIKTEREAILATTAIYNIFLDWNFHSGGFPLLDIMSDDANKGSNPGDGGGIELFNTFQFTASAGDISRWYSALYKGVRRANIVLTNVPSIAMDEVLKTRLLGEAHFLRAVFYFDLVRAFGDLPKVTMPAAARILARSPKQEIYTELIIPDLLAAIENLPEKSDYAAADAGRSTKGAAKSLLAKVYIFQNDFINAEKYALEVIASGQYDLEPDFSNAFSLEGQFGTESVFEIGAEPNSGGSQFANTQGVRGIPNRGWGFNRPSVELINFFETDDIRKDATVVFLGETIDGVLIQGDAATPNITYSNPPTNTIIKEIETYNQKVWVPGTGTLEQFGYNKRIIRYADVLLMAAEALNENNKTVAALVPLNMVRERAGLLPLDNIDQATLRQKIADERRAELSMEGNRFWDLVRTGKADEVLAPWGFVTGKHELFPIPQSEIDLSEGTLTQNLNWN